MDVIDPQPDPESNAGLAQGPADLGDQVHAAFPVVADRLVDRPVAHVNEGRPGPLEGSDAQHVPRRAGDVKIKCVDPGVPAPAQRVLAMRRCV